LTEDEIQNGTAPCLRPKRANRKRRKIQIKLKHLYSRSRESGLKNAALGSAQPDLLWMKNPLRASVVLKMEPIFENLNQVVMKFPENALTAIARMVKNGLRMLVIAV